MENEIATLHSLSAKTPKARRAFVALGLWLRLGMVGAFGLVAGLLQLVDGEVKPLSALALMIGGGAMLAIGGWRARTMIDHIDDAAVATSGASSAARATQVGAVSRGARPPPLRAAALHALSR